MAALLPALGDRPATGPIDVAGEKAAPQAAAEGAAVGRAAAGRWVLLDVPSSRPWRHPLAMWWRQCRRTGPHAALFAALEALRTAAQAGFDRDNQGPHQVRSMMRAPAA